MSANPEIRRHIDALVAKIPDLASEAATDALYNNVVAGPAALVSLTVRVASGMAVGITPAETVMMLTLVALRMRHERDEALAKLAAAEDRLVDLLAAQPVDLGGAK